MKRTAQIQMITVFLLCAALVACASAPVTFHSMKDQPYDATKGRTVSGSACGFQLLLWFPILTNHRAELAYNELMVKAGPDYVTDVKVRERWIYAFIGTVYCTEIEATAYPKLSLMSTPSGTAVQ